MQGKTLSRCRALIRVAGLLAICAGIVSGCLCIRPAPSPPTIDTPSPTRVPVSSSPKVSTSSPTATQAFLPIVARQSVRYGVVYPYPNTWTEEDRPAIRERLTYLKGLGVNVVVQVFSSAPVDTGQEQDWLIFLDEAQAEDIQVIARLWPPHDWDGSQFDFTYVEPFLTVVQGHPALLAYFGLHEPLETFNGDQLRAYYQAVKRFAPDVPIFHAMSDIAGFEADPRFGDRRFTDGICDLCAIWYYPFRVQGGESVAEYQRVSEVIAANDALVRERDPDAQIWFLGQTYAMAGHPPPLRMPSAEEMRNLAQLLLEDPHIDGLLWYPWNHSSYDQVLGDPASSLQREAVQSIYEQYLKETDLPSE